MQCVTSIDRNAGRRRADCRHDRLPNGDACIRRWLPSRGSYGSCPCHYQNRQGQVADSLAGIPSRCDYPHWLDNLADDVVLQGAVFNGELRGADEVGKMLSFARSLYAFQDFRFYGMRGDLFLEDYRSRIRGTEAYHPDGVEIYNFVVVYFNDKGETSQLVMNHRPQSAVLLFSSLLHKHFGDTFDPSLYYDGDARAHILDRDLSRGQWPPN
jgi:hypothetical protein